MAQGCMLQLCLYFILGCAVKVLLGQLGQAMFAYHAVVKDPRKVGGDGVMEMST